ncbi:hypothetical protein Nepgr_009472 [Nepenthes gracilis]|uniref:Uncharacterized protein n=1 Tax=Nepenthes gracilis TaxID=150966 RepID=A0AAD3XK65_NEPGR|nr:hypothetical protein Nepgr_009472 [Nepenthes gracilis]
MEASEEENEPFVWPWLPGKLVVESSLSVWGRDKFMAERGVKLGGSLSAKCERCGSRVSPSSGDSTLCHILEIFSPSLYEIYQISSVLVIYF